MDMLQLAMGKSVYYIIPNACSIVYRMIMIYARRNFLKLDLKYYF